LPTAAGGNRSCAGSAMPWLCEALSHASMDRSGHADSSSLRTPETGDASVQVLRVAEQPSWVRTARPGRRAKQQPAGKARSALHHQTERLSNGALRVTAGSAPRQGAWAAGGWRRCRPGRLLIRRRPREERWRHLHSRRRVIRPPEGSCVSPITLRASVMTHLQEGSEDAPMKGSLAALPRSPPPENECGHCGAWTDQVRARSAFAGCPRRASAAATGDRQLPQGYCLS